jgi:alpha-tubulin suppressor-like RCC1 family protein
MQFTLLGLRVRERARHGRWGLSFATLRVSVTGLHTCGITTTRMTYCWGDNSEGQLGTGSTTNSATLVKVAVQP